MITDKEILVLYYSQHGAVRQMAQLLARGQALRTGVGGPEVIVPVGRFAHVGVPLLAIPSMARPAPQAG